MDYKIITISQLDALLSAWGAGQDVEKTCFLIEPKNNDCYIAVDNTSGDFFIETFKSRSLCLEYFEGVSLEELYQQVIN